MRTILCPIDLSGLSHRAVQYASEIAVRTGSRLVLFYAFDAPYLEPHCALGYAGKPANGWRRCGSNSSGRTPWRGLTATARYVWAPRRGKSRSTRQPPKPT
jgi:hypothetical protein